jgi:hypothetical protein
VRQSQQPTTAQDVSRSAVRAKGHSIRIAGIEFTDLWIEEQVRAPAGRPQGVSNRREIDIAANS